ncbi:MAG: putative S18 family serine protease [Natronomonas sp.]|jgi:predicted S18 family serine protease|uniref:hypothetical protein n=1 Tax=Natronomonas sp. TaxID=2184060 RepID=UPI00398961D1
MASNDSDQDASESTRTDPIDDFEQSLLDRREFLLGAGLGAVSVGGLVGGHALAEGPKTERLATLASSSVGTSSVQYALPATDGNGNGIVVRFTVAVTPGAGDIYVGLDNVEVRHDIQLAIREATELAGDMSDSSLDGRDVLVSFTPPGDDRMALRGKSWEAGLTAGLISILSDQSLTTNTLVTGLVGTEGTLLPVGNIDAKARGAREFGADQLFVPPDQSISVPGIRVEGVENVSEIADRLFQ